MSDEPGRFAGPLIRGVSRAVAAVLNSNGLKVGGGAGFDPGQTRLYPCSLFSSGRT